MTDPVARLIVAFGVIALSGLAAFLFNRFRRPAHPPITVGEVGDRPGIVMFTSGDCSTCKRAIDRVEAEGVSFREVAYELEPQRFTTWDVVAVPLTVILDAGGAAVGVLPGVPATKALRRAIAAAGIKDGA